MMCRVWSPKVSFSNWKVEVCVKGVLCLFPLIDVYVTSPKLPSRVTDQTGNQVNTQWMPPSCHMLIRCGHFTYSIVITLAMTPEAELPLSYCRCSWAVYSCLFSLKRVKLSLSLQYCSCIIPTLYSEPYTHACLLECTAVFAPSWDPEYKSNLPYLPLWFHGAHRRTLSPLWAAIIQVRYENIPHSQYYDGWKR